MPTALMPLIAYILVCVLIGIAARGRAIGFWGGVALSIVLTPVLAVLILVLTRPRRGSQKLAKPAGP